MPSVPSEQTQQLYFLFSVEAQQEAQFNPSLRREETRHFEPSKATSTSLLLVSVLKKFLTNLQVFDPSELEIF